eukprot:358866-Pelagomonas_calceolata.AAC.2
MVSCNPSASQDRFLPRNWKGERTIATTCDVRHGTQQLTSSQPGHRLTSLQAGIELAVGHRASSAGRHRASSAGKLTEVLPSVQEHWSFGTSLQGSPPFAKMGAKQPFTLIKQLHIPPLQQNPMLGTVCPTLRPPNTSFGQRWHTGLLTTYLPSAAEAKFKSAASLACTNFFLCFVYDSAQASPAAPCQYFNGASNRSKRKTCLRFGQFEDKASRISASNQSKASLICGICMRCYFECLGTWGPCKVSLHQNVRLRKRTRRVIAYKIQAKWPPFSMAIIVAPPKPKQQQQQQQQQLKYWLYVGSVLTAYMASGPLYFCLAGSLSTSSGYAQAEDLTQLCKSLGGGHLDTAPSLNASAQSG